MSRDQKPGKVRHVGAVQERRQSDMPAPPGAAGAAAGGDASGAGAAADAAAPPAIRGGIGLIAILMFLVFAGVSGGGIVALAPTLGLWP